MSADCDPVEGSSYRSLILSRLEIREKNQRTLKTMFKNYSILAEQLSRSRKSRQSFCDGGEIMNLDKQLAAMKEEVANVYKMKSKNDQDLIEANRKLAEAELRIAAATSQRDKLKSNTDSLSSKIAKMEVEISELKESNSAMNIERIALLTTCNQLTAKNAELENERIQLLNKIRQLQEKRAELMNAEIKEQEERAQRKIMEQIENATQDYSYDDGPQTAHGQSPETSDEFIMTDIIPQNLKFHITAHDGEVNDIEWFSEDVYGTAGSDNKIRIWRVSSGKTEATKIASLVGCNGPITRLDYDPQRRVCLAGSNDKTCRLWNVDSQRLLNTFSGHTDKVTSARLFQLHHVISGSTDRTIKLWDVASIRCVRTFMVGSSVFDTIAKCGISHSNFASAHFDKKVRFWDSRQPDPIRMVELGHRVTSLDVSYDGIQLLAACRDDTLSMFDIRTFALLHMYSSELYRTSCDNTRAIFSSTGEFVASGSATGAIFVWNTKSTRLEKVLRMPRIDGNAVLSLSWNPSGRGILACDRQKTCSLWR